MRNQKEWDKAKTKFYEIFFPDEVVGKLSNSGETHNNGKHDLQSYKIEMNGIEGFRVVGAYNYCPKCNQVMNKKMTMYNSGTPPVGFQQGVCVERVLIRHGIQVEND